jgi:hypothetical protein
MKNETKQVAPGSTLIGVAMQLDPERLHIALTAQFMGDRVFQFSTIVPKEELIPMSGAMRAIVQQIGGTVVYWEALDGGTAWCFASGARGIFGKYDFVNKSCTEGLEASDDGCN